MHSAVSATRSLAQLRGFATGLAGVVVTLFGLILMTFLIGRAMPIDPARAMVGDRAPPDVVNRVREELGLDKPLLEQFWIYIKHMAAGDFGTSVLTTRPVTTDILYFFPATLELATVALVISLLIGIPLGVIAAARQDSFFDHCVRVISLLGQSTPVFVLALICLLVFYVELGIAPGTGRQDILFQGTVPQVTRILVIDAALAGQWDAFHDALAHLAMPALLLAFYSLSTIVRMTRTFMLEALSGEYIIAARARGLSATRILWRHAFPNVLGRLVAIIALVYAGLLEGAVLTETVFSWPGLGLYLTLSLLNADMNAVLATTLVIGTVYVGLNLLADLAYRLIDPRVR
jgi:peptide/nickel transport system permease protein